MPVQRRLCPRTCSRHRCASWTTRASTGLCPCPAASTGVQPGVTRTHPHGGYGAPAIAIYPFANLCQKSSEVPRRLCKRFNAVPATLIPGSTQTHLRKAHRGFYGCFCINWCYTVLNRHFNRLNRLIYLYFNPIVNNLFFQPPKTPEDEVIPPGDTSTPGFVECFELIQSKFLFHIASHTLGRC